VTKLVDAPQVNHASILTPLGAFIAPASGLFHHFLAYNHIDARYRQMRLAKLPGFSVLPDEDMSLFPSTASVAPTPIITGVSPSTSLNRPLLQPFRQEPLLSHTVSAESLGRMYDSLSEDEFRTLLSHVARLCERVDTLQRTLRTSLTALLFAEGHSRHDLVAALLRAESLDSALNSNQSISPATAAAADTLASATASLRAVDTLMGSSVLSAALARARWVCHETHFLLFDVMAAGTHPKVSFRVRRESLAGENRGDGGVFSEIGGHTVEIMVKKSGFSRIMFKPRILMSTATTIKSEQISTAFSTSIRQNRWRQPLRSHQTHILQKTMTTTATKWTHSYPSAKTTGSSRT